MRPLVEDERKRIAVMNPSAVEEALVYHGPVHYYTGRFHVNLPETTLVEVGKWKAEGGERSREDRLCTYFAAQILGLETEWLPCDEETSDRKLLIGAGRDEEDQIISFSEERAGEIAAAINEVYALAKKHQENLFGVSES